jgi:Tfp pilus assembly protein PilE
MDVLNCIQMHKSSTFVGYAVFGFSLLELTLVVFIISILMVVALPSYQAYIAKGNRADAKQKLSEIMFEQERYQLRKRIYTTDLRRLGYTLKDGGVVSDFGFYRVTARRCSDESRLNHCIELHAEPLKILMPHWEQALTLDSRDRRTGDW